MKKIKIITIIVLIILITMVSFFGVYVYVQNRMEDKVRDYELDMDLKGARYVRLTVNTGSTDVIKDADGNEVQTEEEMTDEQLAENGYTKESVPNNAEGSLTAENYEKSKKIIEERLDSQGVGEYEISVDNETGDILVQIPENDYTDNFVSNMNTVGKFQIIDSDTQEVLMDNGDIKKVNVMYGSSSSTTSGTAVYLNIEFNKEGKEKFKNISSTYVEAENTTNTTSENTTNTATDNTSAENTENETVANETAENTSNETVANETTETTTKEVTMKIDDQEIMTTSFDEPIEDGTLPLQIGSATTDQDTLQDYITQATTMASVLNSGDLPIQYDINTENNEYILSDITSTQIQYVALAVGIVLLIGLVVFVIRYKLNGFLSAIAFVGLISVYLLVIRYTNVSISIQGIVGIVVTIVLNYIFINKILSKIKKSEDSKNLENVRESIKEGYKEFFIRIVPICISIIAFCFADWTTISSFGMVMFWGAFLIALYNYLITATMLKVKAEK